MFEPSEIGPLCKKLRQSKGLSLRDVSGNFLSTSFLSKFERGASDISVSRFFQLLDCMDVTIEEFYYLLSRDYIPSTERLIAKVGAAFRQHNILALKKYYREEKKRYEETRNKRHLYNMIMIESFIVKETDGRRQNYSACHKA